MNAKRILSNVGWSLIPIVVIGFWILGALHGKKKHGIKPLSDNFLVCWYYGIEQFWHKIDYDELRDEVKVAVFLLSSKPTGMDARGQIEFNESKREFRRSLSKLSKKELSYVKEGVEAFLNYMESFQKNIYESTIAFKTTHRFEYIESEESKLLLEKSADYGLSEQVDEIKNGIGVLVKRMKERLESGDIDENDLDAAKLKNEMNQQMQDVRRTYAEIFK
jgi:hypothetical protein